MKTIVAVVCSTLIHLPSVIAVVSRFKSAYHFVVYPHQIEMVQTDGMAGEARTGRFWEVFVRDSGGRGAGLSMSNGELVMYQTEDGLAQISLTAIDGTVWLTQNEIGVL